MEDETSGKGSTLILGRPFVMTTITKIDVHVGTLSMEFGDTLVEFNIFEAMKHPTVDHSLFGIDLVDELVEEYFQLDIDTEQQLPVIIANNLHREEEEKLLDVLRQHKKAMGLPHKAIEKKAESNHPRRGQERRIIYPISDNQLISPVQVVPKKSGMTIKKNQHDELVPMLIQNNWRVCIDYRRLNQETRKDHFPLPRLIWWMLLLQEFNIEIRDKKGVENSIAYHLSQIERKNICNFVAASQFQVEASQLYKEKLRSDAKYYIWDDPYLWRLYNDQVIHKCILDTEITSHLEATIMDQLRQLEKCLIAGSINLPFLEMPINLSPPTKNVKK
ncbi:hypothetical protein CR513_19863, partial [Mucuna pruriens]